MGQISFCLFRRPGQFDCFSLQVLPLRTGCCYCSSHSYVKHYQIDIVVALIVAAVVVISLDCQFQHQLTGANCWLSFSVFLVEHPYFVAVRCVFAQAQWWQSSAINAAVVKYRNSWWSWCACFFVLGNATDNSLNDCSKMENIII